MSKKTTTWRQNFRRWSVQLATAMALLSSVEAVAQVAVAFQSTLPLWQPVMPSWAFATTSSVVSVLIVVLRNLRQEGVE